MPTLMQEYERLTKKIAIKDPSLVRENYDSCQQYLSYPEHLKCPVKEKEIKSKVKMIERVAKENHLKL